MAQKLLQPSFASGELSPALWGRVDLDRYGIGARALENWVCRVDGGIQSRVGTLLVREAKEADKLVRLLPFDVADNVSYVMELGHLYARFHYHGATVVDGFDVPVEIVTPWTEDQLFDVSITQSADTLFLAHAEHKIRLIKRTDASTFTISEFTTREGPFRSLNSNEAQLLAASAKTGTVTVSSNFDLFNADMVGGLIYLEPKTLGQIKPWVQGERTPSLVAGALRRSDGKVYRASTVPTPPAGAGNFTETGNVRPLHEVGKEWDGPGDQHDLTGGVSWKIGVEWEYMHSGYGIVEITAFTDARTVTGLVKRTLPDEVVGGVGTPSNTWTRSGNGISISFSITGATSNSTGNYTVTIDGVAIQPNPNYVSPGSGGSWEAGPIGYVP